MADPVDMATDIVAEHLARGLARICQSIAIIPAGEPGECDACFETMPRIVDGMCAPCRDRAAKMRILRGTPE